MWLNGYGVFVYYVYLGIDKERVSSVLCYFFEYFGLVVDGGNVLYLKIILEFQIKYFWCVDFELKLILVY